MCGYFFVLLKARNHSAKSSLHMHLNLEDDFGKKGATLSKNKPGVWRYPNSAPKSIHERIKLEGANCNKSIVSYGNLQGAFGVLDLMCWQIMIGEILLVGLSTVAQMDR